MLYEVYDMANESSYKEKNMRLSLRLLNSLLDKGNNIYNRKLLVEFSEGGAF